MDFDPSVLTQAVHAGAQAEPRTGAIMVPIFQTSTYVQESPGSHKGYDYSRADNPTREALEKALAVLEHCPYALSFSSGLAAEQAIIQLLPPNCSVMVCDDVYGGTGRLFRKLFAKYNIEFKFVDMQSASEVQNAVDSKLKLIWVETPTNPLLKIIDIQKMAELAKKHQALLVVDNTFASPVFQNPLSLGADIVIHSTTKYMGGHSDLIGGALMTARKDLFEELKFIQFAAGAVPSPMECFLLHRSIKTLGVRMLQHEKNAIKVAEFLASHPKVKQVFYPGLSNHSGYDVAKKQMKGFSGIVSFILKGNYDDVLKFLRPLQFFSLAESLGGVESLVNHPEKMTHASVPEPLRQKLGIGSNLLRLSVGIENGEDLVEDLRGAFR